MIVANLMLKMAHVLLLAFAVVLGPHVPTLKLILSGCE